MAAPVTDAVLPEILVLAGGHANVAAHHIGLCGGGEIAGFFAMQPKSSAISNRLKRGDAARDPAARTAIFLQQRQRFRDILMRDEAAIISQRIIAGIMISGRSP